MAANKILVIEDNEDYCLFYQDLLGTENKLTVLHSLASLKAHLATTDLNSYDLVLADLMLEDGYFMDWLTKTNSTFMEQVPTIIVSSLEDIDILRHSFEWGAVDYLIKPFRRNELLVKVEKARRNFSIKPQAAQANEEELRERLTAIESKIFQLFSARVGQHLSREEIMKAVWTKVRVQPKTMDVYFSNLRKRMQGSPWMIEYEDEKGWKLCPTIKLK